MPFDLGDDTELARQLLADLAGEHPHHLIADADELYLYRETGLWQPVDDATIIARTTAYSGQPLVGKRSKTGVPRRLEVNGNRAKGALGLLKAMVHQPGFFSDAPAGVPFEDGFLTVAADGATSIVPLSSEHRARWSYPFPYEPNRQPERFKAFLREIATDPISVDFIQEYFGLCIIGSAHKFERIVFAVGAAGTGNSTLGSIATACMPDGSVVSVPPGLMKNEFNRIALKNALLNAVDDLPHAEPLASGFTKSIASGQAIQARHLYKESETIRPRCGSWFGCNTLPPCSDTSDGWRRRPVILQFPNRIPDEERDRNLCETILEERAIIVPWLIKGAARAISRNVLSIPPGNARLVDLWVSAYDNLGAYIRERLVEIRTLAVDEKTWLKSEAIYPDYQEWSKAAGLRNPRNRQTFERELGQRVRRIHNAHGSWYAVRLRADVDREKAEKIIESMN